MSYDISISVKVEGTDIYEKIAEPEFCNPTYDIGEMLRECMDWNYSQSKIGEDGECHSCYYRCDSVIKKVEHGIYELTVNSKKYKQFEPKNRCGSIETAINALESLRKCIYEQAENIPIEHLYMSWRGERMTRKEMLEEAAKIVCTDRNKQYGEPEDNFGRIADFWSTYYGAPFNATDVAIMMALFKIGRIATCGEYKEDSFVDCAGYISCACEIATGGKE